MSSTDVPENAGNVASHTLAHLRSHGKKLDLILETLERQNERLGRLERDGGEVRRDLMEIRRDMLEIKSDIVLLENKVLSAQSEVLTILYRLDEAAAAQHNPSSEAEPK